MKFSLIKKHIVLGVTLALSASLVSCNDFLDINETPNNPLAVPPSTLLPTGLVGSAFANANELNRFTSAIMSVTAGVAGSPVAYDRYNTNGADFGNQWRFELYGGALVNYQQLIDAAERVNSPAYTGIAKIMKAYTFSIATDVWGDVPYSEALLGEENTQPALDSQRDIYLGNEAEGIQSLFDLVREGIADLDKASATRPGSDDLVYGGTLANWKKAGNTLLLKFAMQISVVEPAVARDVINAVVQANNYIVANDENLAVKFGSVVGSQNPIHTYTNVSSFRTDQMISTRFVSLLQGLNDPRLDLFVTKPTGSFVTIDNGFGGTAPVYANRSLYNTYVTGPSTAAGSAPVRLLTNWQRAFILAEAVIRLGVAGDAQALFTEGIRASMTAAGVTPAAIDAYFAANPTVVTLAGTPEQQIQQIITQKYISMFGNGLEQWNDWRRTGYPTLAPHQNAVGIDGTRPVRAQYIDQEVARNPNFPNNVYSNVPVWWDVN
ncbi:SusD/RagB family nutrient-binding outer membrane lipoprotein [Pontibacter qinzhouensis]|uniref:SusD/RagB family nutrient-binding outer membrane lipoprotein n=1 Tax=Pontibacter qinzhouensis TaxID=2603253 RepID=A0A5C8K9E3_9BACT|nr:SusD/RagB family nutrient-binding outer membrane lipoprotein [Pontibacter qinzhouensis]TXK46435.1 SusD/RagB family nutrient-binding outer membrane lipoprotein [Pontibacter qinzhouensis]